MMIAMIVVVVAAPPQRSYQIDAQQNVRRVHGLGIDVVALGTHGAR
eukprot:CAMPEP_0168759710 /NCGR_PEP_ID=MMETSP0724-20121128/22372_1 /TAXON_ID=265536 /ORGANISM="Amphiprora sp., Strain CCMP467" /LENGTH=45 /DNA_ID= /DNA_START= /DNA_END= /DNA_ORIENTATION=